MARMLFREEAVAAQGERSLGDVMVASPPGLRLFTVIAFLITVALVGYAYFGHYTRKAHVSGYLAPDQGLIKVHAPVTGTLIAKQVREGQSVKQGDTLFILSTERGSPETPAAQQSAIESLVQRRESVRGELLNQTRIDTDHKRNLQERLRGFEQELQQLDAALATQRQRLVSAEETAGRFRDLAARRFVAELQAREKDEQVLEQRSRFEALQRERSALLRNGEGLRRDLAGYDLQAANRRAALERDVGALNEQLTAAESRRSVVIAAPAAGTVTAILAERGQTAAENAPLLTILPAETVFEAQLLVPSRAIGFIVPGQDVALRYQAFPYQRYGSARGRIKEIARTLITPGEVTLPVPLREPVYRVTVALQVQSIRAYRREFALQSGMLLDADVWLDRRRIIEWLFDPLYSVVGRV